MASHTSENYCFKVCNKKSDYQSVDDKQKHKRRLCTKCNEQDKIVALALYISFVHLQAVLYKT